MPNLEVRIVLTEDLHMNIQSSPGMAPDIVEMVVAQALASVKREVLLVRFAQAKAEAEKRVVLANGKVH